MDADNAAALRFFKIVRKFCAQARADTIGVMFVEATPSDRWDVSKLSERIYGTRYEVLAVMAACEMDTFSQPLEQKTIAIPTPEKLAQLKREAGFESIHNLRSEGKPTWIRQ